MVCVRVVILVYGVRCCAVHCGAGASLHPSGYAYIFKHARHALADVDLRASAELGSELGCEAGDGPAVISRV